MRKENIRSVFSLFNDLHIGAQLVFCFSGERVATDLSCLAPSLTQLHCHVMPAAILTGDAF